MNKWNPKVIIRSLGTGILIGLIGIGVLGALHYLNNKQYPPPDRTMPMLDTVSLIVATVIALIILLASLLAQYAEFKPPKSFTFISDLLLFGALFAIIWSIPLSILHWFINPQHLKRAIQIAVFLMSIGTSTIYVVIRKDRFPSPAAKVSFIGGICCTSVLAVQVLL